MKSLENDVGRCTEIENDEIHKLFDTAPFPALCYCFATVDLLGALYAGDVREHRPSSTQARKYMVDFMGYKTDAAELLQDIFRHKIVHLAQPDPILVRNSHRIAWYIETQSHPRIHLRLDNLSPTENKIKTVTSKLTLEWDQIFHISVRDFQHDIKNSVESPTGYLASLKSTPASQENFAKAILEIYS
jgi:hypothetical protein